MRKMVKIVFFSLLFILVSRPAPSYAGQVTYTNDNNDRFAVAASISSKWVQSDTIVLLNYQAFEDSLTATPLAKKLNAPILFTRADHLPDETKRLMQSLEVKNVVIVGDERSISQKVIFEMNSFGISNSIRISLKDRFLNSKNTNSQTGSNETELFANGLVFTDALSIVPNASITSYPIFLTKNNELPLEFVHLLNSSIKTALGINSEASGSQEEFIQLPDTSRIDRNYNEEPAVDVIAYLGQNSRKDHLEKGVPIVNAHTGSVLAAKENSVTLLKNRDRLPPSTLRITKKNDVPISVLGGIGSLKYSVVQAHTTVKPSKGPILYIVPHQDDEILSFGVDIRNELTRGRKVQLILLTRGEDSSSRDILNGKVYCSIHKRYHNPAEEAYKAGTLTPDEFADARTDEYFRASKALGVPAANIHTEFIPPGKFYGSEVREIIQKYLVLYPNADVRTFSWFDEHSAHALLGRTVKGMQTDGILQRYQAKYFISINTDRFYPVPKPMLTIMNRLENPNDVQYLRRAIGEYERFDPRNGYYAVGYHSVKVQFDALSKDPYVNSHY